MLQEHAPAPKRDPFLGRRGVGRIGNISDRLGASAPRALTPASQWLPLIGSLCGMARLLGITRWHAHKIIYGTSAMPAHIARKLQAEMERRSRACAEAALMFAAVAEEREARKERVRGAARQRFYDRWGFWPETAADKEARWAKMREAPGKPRRDRSGGT